MSEGPSFPFPIPDPDTEPYWEACNREELHVQRCEGCQTLRFTPGPGCGACGSLESRWERLSGRGEVTTWTVVTHPIHPAAIERVPYIVAEIELEEQAGLRIITNLLEVAPDSVAVGLPVELTFETHPSGQKLPQFRPR